MSKILNNELGYSFLFALFILIMVSIAGITLINSNSNSLKLSGSERENQSLFYISEAGITYEKETIHSIVRTAYNETREMHRTTKKENRSSIDFTKIYINKIKDNIAMNFPTYFSNFETQYSYQPQAKIVVQIKSENPLIIEMTSSGYFIEKESIKRSVTQVINIDMNLKFLSSLEDDKVEEGHIALPKLAVQTKGDIFLKGSASIDGSVASSNGKVIFNGNEGVNITGIVGVAPENFIKGKDSGNGNKILTEKRVKSVDVTEYTLPEFPVEKMEELKNANYPADFKLVNGTFTADWNSKSNYTLKGNTKFKDFIVPDGRNITIDIGSSHVNLLVENNFSLGSGGDIKILGSGTLNIYVKNAMTIHGELGNTSKDPNNINIYYAGSSTPRIIDGGKNIASSLYVQSANLELGGGAGISGNIISGGSQIKIGNGSRPTGQYILAPNAHVQLGGNYKGVIMARSYTGDGYGTVTYAPGIVPLPIVREEQPDYSDPSNLIIEEDLIEI